MAVNTFEIKNLSYAYKINRKKSKKILDDISFSIKEGKITTLIGANGSGKSTLFNLMTKNLVNYTGEIFYETEDIKKIHLRDFARKVAIVHQKNYAPLDLTVEKLVEYGRFPFKKHCSFAKDTNDDEIVKWALETTEIYDIKDKAIGNLSGGQLQRAFISMGLAQGTKTLLLDEPTTFLDIKYQVEILRLLKSLNEKFNMTIIMILHDINQAIHYSDEIIALKSGKIISQGNPKDLINEEIIKEVYSIDLKMNTLGDCKFIMPI